MTMFGLERVCRTHLGGPQSQAMTRFFLRSTLIFLRTLANLARA